MLNGDEVFQVGLDDIWTALILQTNSYFCVCIPMQLKFAPANWLVFTNATNVPFSDIRYVSRLDEDRTARDLDQVYCIIFHAVLARAGEEIFNGSKVSAYGWMPPSLHPGSLAIMSRKIE